MSPLCVRQTDLKCHFCLEPAWQSSIFWKLETCVKNCAQSFPYRQRDTVSTCQYTVVRSGNPNCQPFAKPFTMSAPPKWRILEIEYSIFFRNLIWWCGLFVAIVKTTLSCQWLCRTKINKLMSKPWEYQNYKSPWATWSVQPTNCKMPALCQADWRIWDVIFAWNQRGKAEFLGSWRHALRCRMFSVLAERQMRQTQTDVSFTFGFIARKSRKCVKHPHCRAPSSCANLSMFDAHNHEL